MNRFALLTAGAFLATAWMQNSPTLLAPTGTLRAAFLGTNPVHARVDAKTGEVSGPVRDLTQELARRLGVPYTMIPAADAKAVVGHVQGGTADIGFLAYEEARAKEVDFAGGFAMMPLTYVVRADSVLQKPADADRAGVRVGAVKGQTPEIYVSANLKQARVRVFDTTPPDAELQRLLVAGEIDAFALNVQRGTDLVTSSKSAVRMLPGSFFEVEQAFVVKKGDPQKVEMIRRFVDEVRASGFIKGALDRAKLAGVTVAPGR